jgi:hypothetical protein
MEETAQRRHQSLGSFSVLFVKGDESKTKSAKNVCSSVLIFIEWLTSSAMSASLDPATARVNSSAF